MLLTKEEKRKTVQDLREQIAVAKSVIFSDYRGLKVNDLQTLRKKLKINGISLKVIKNTLLARALKEQKIEIDASILTKPLTCAFSSSDEVGPAKIIYQFTKENENLKLLGGIIEDQFIDLDQVKVLALLPSREQLYAQLLGSLNAPIYGLINVLKGNLRSLVYILEQYRQQKV